jgi:hypothetical protein
MKFDRSDLPFVAVAFPKARTNFWSARTVITREQVCDYLQQHLRVKILSLPHALKIAENIQDH